MNGRALTLLGERFGASAALLETAGRAEAALGQAVDGVEAIAAANQARVLQAFLDAGVGEEDLAESTGYGYHSVAHERIEQVFASAFGAEDALVSMGIVSGTHAIALALFGNLKPGDELVAATGQPYDTLKEVIGAGGGRDGGEGRGIHPPDHAVPGSLAAMGVTYREVPLAEGGRPDPQALAAALSPRTAMVIIQKSRGYAFRPSLSCERIGELVEVVRRRALGAVVFVDNCYGEFVEDREPLTAGADLIAGSLIKNPGGGLAPGGGYVAGRATLVEGARRRLTAPGVGGRGRMTAADARQVLQGLFLAPMIVGEAVKSAHFAAALFKELGYQVLPAPGEDRHDLIQGIRLGSEARLVAFCRGVQRASPVNSRVRPEPAPMEGYPDRILMAAGAFVQGSSIELSADAPIRPPFDVYVQGGLSYAHAQIALVSAAAALGH